MKPLYLAVLLSLLPVAARAQVFVNQAALDQLAGVQAAVPETTSPVMKRPVVHRHVPARVFAVAMKSPAPAVLAKPAPVVQPVVAKPAPVVVPPVQKLPPAGPVTVAFAAGGTDLPSGAAASLQLICKRAGADGLVTIDAYGPVVGLDVSAPMRTSLTRAFAVRDVLTACGVPAAHIIPRADGAVTGKDPDSAVVSLGVGSTGQSK